jgi:hydrogenase maturation factor
MGEDRITLSHGAGGAVMQKLIAKNILKRFSGVKSEVDIEIPLEDLEEMGSYLPPILMW